MEQKTDLDALEAAYKKANLPDTLRIVSAILRLHPHDPADACSSEEDEACLALAHNALPALVAELRELRARTTPEPISDKHRDGNWWLVWVPGFEHWLKCRFRHDQWMLSGPATAGLCDAPTHALPMPPPPEEANA